MSGDTSYEKLQRHFESIETKPTNSVEIATLERSMRTLFGFLKMQSKGKELPSESFVRQAICLALETFPDLQGVKVTTEKVAVEKPKVPAGFPPKQAIEIHSLHHEYIGLSPGEYVLEATWDSQNGVVIQYRLVPPTR